jgi:hypothetical protein
MPDKCRMDLGGNRQPRTALSNGERAAAERHLIAPHDGLSQPAPAF